MDDMQKLVGFAISLLILVVVFYLGPGVGEAVSTALPATSGEFSNATTGAEIWNAGTSISIVVVIVAMIGVALAALYKLQKN